MGAIRPQAEFDPASWRGEFRIGMCDNLESAFFGPLAARLLKLSPGARLIGIASEKRDAARRLDEGVFDFSVSVHDEPASWHIRAPLFDQSSICIYDAAQLRLKAPLSLKDFANVAHVTVSSTDAAPGEFGKAVFRVPTESETASTTKLVVTLPADAPFAFVSAQSKPGWKPQRTG